MSVKLRHVGSFITCAYVPRDRDDSHVWEVLAHLLEGVLNSFSQHVHTHGVTSSSYEPKVKHTASQTENKNMSLQLDQQLQGWK